LRRRRCTRASGRRPSVETWASARRAARCEGASSHPLHSPLHVYFREDTFATLSAAEHGQGDYPIAQSGIPSGHE
jgi:hypothetical protein